VEEQVRGLREDVAAMTAEFDRTRKRLHTLESTTQGMVKLEQASREITLQRQRGIEIRLQILTFAVAFVGTMLAIAVALVHA
jgi:hypothetical protein